MIGFMGIGGILFIILCAIGFYHNPSWIAGFIYGPIVLFVLWRLYGLYTR